MPSALELHEKLRGKIEIKPKIKLTSKNLPLLYTPGVAGVALEIAKDPKNASRYTIKNNTVAVVTDGSRLLGLGNQGPYAALPVMEGKALLFKELANINAFPICLNTQEPKAFIETVKAIAPAFAGINLEDIASPKCFEIEQVLKKELSIPVFHDDQHGTSTIILAALINALKVIKKSPGEIKAVILGAGAAGIATAHLLLDYGVKQLHVFDSKGHLSHNSDSPYKKELANRLQKPCTFQEALKNANLLITLSGRANIFIEKDLQGMAKDPIIFSLSNPVPEIPFKEAKTVGRIIASGGSLDYKNKINNMLSFPCIWKAALDTHTHHITKKVQTAIAEAIAAVVPSSQLNENHILPAMSKNLVKNVAKKVKF